MDHSPSTYATTAYLCGTAVQSESESAKNTSDLTLSFSAQIRVEVA
jgi:hypothetical protein